MRFRYLTDPLFLLSLALYALNRWWLKPTLSFPFLREYLNDVLCIPFCVPLMLFMARAIGLRKNDGRPSATEILVPLILWSLVFECVLPHVALPGTAFTADPIDILCYLSGACIATWWWGMHKPAVDTV